MTRPEFDDVLDQRFKALFQCGVAIESILHKDLTKGLNALVRLENGDIDENRRAIVIKGRNDSNIVSLLNRVGDDVAGIRVFMNDSTHRLGYERDEEMTSRIECVIVRDPEFVFEQGSVQFIDGDSALNDRRSLNFCEQLGRCNIRDSRNIIARALNMKPKWSMSEWNPLWVTNLLLIYQAHELFIDCNDIGHTSELTDFSRNKIISLFDIATSIPKTIH